jgi:hypothetical protein
MQGVKEGLQALWGYSTHLNEYKKKPVNIWPEISACSDMGEFYI